MSKRIFMIMCVGLLGSFMAACGKGNDTNNSNNSNVSNTTVEDNTQVKSEDTTKEDNLDMTVTKIEEDIEDTKNDVTEEERKDMANKVKVSIGDYSFTAKLEDTTAAKELAQMMKDGPVVLELEDYSGFEKVGSLGTSLTRSDKQTTTKSGDIVLYNGSNIVIFYGSNSWSYTRIGKIDDLKDWEKALGSGSVTVTFEVED